jgi:hypothetical protein
MINSVRNTVLALLNKNNYGYLSPSDFNLFAKQAQMDIFNDYFYQITYQTNKENARLSGTGISDINKQYKETLETFIRPSDVLTYDADNKFFAPSPSTTGFEFHTILNVYCYDTTTTPKTFIGEAEKGSPTQIVSLENSLLQKPSRVFPTYIYSGDRIYIYPKDITGANAVECQYIRYPKDPKWTFVTLAGGSPVFDQSQSDYQDFELHPDDEVELVTKICQYAGLMIRDADVVNFTKSEQAISTQSEQ